MMNKSVVKLRSDLDLYSGIIVKHTNQLVNVEHNISELHRFILASPIAPGHSKYRADSSIGKSTGLDKLNLWKIVNIFFTHQF